jgi:hypothetical protein
MHGTMNVKSEVMSESAANITTVDYWFLRVVNSPREVLRKMKLKTEGS